jgi:hypothetical protein
MSEEDQQERIQPSTRDKVKPFELVAFSGVLAVFTAIVIIIVTDDLRLMAIYGGIAFIGTLMIFALLALSIRPSKEDQEARERLQRPPGNSGH